MGVLHRRPAATLCLVFFFGLFGAALLSVSTRVILLVLLASALLVSMLLSKKCREAGPFCAVCLSVFLCANGIGYMAFDRYFAREDLFGGDVSVQATVTDIAYQQGDRVSFYADLASVDGHPLHGTVYIQATAGEFEIGDRVTGTVSFTPVTAEDQALHLQSAGVCAVGESADLLCVGRDPGWAYGVRRACADWRMRLSGYITTCLSGESGGLMSAMLLGRVELVSPATKLAFRRLGISHILSISGLHISLLCGAVLAICRRLPMPRTWAYGIQLVLVPAYLALIAFPLCAVRAGIMTLLFSSSRLFARESDSFTTLCLAATGITLFNPYAIYDVGFWLSVVATGAILLYLSRSLKQPRLPGFLQKVIRSLRERIAISLVAGFATLLILSLFFGEFALLSPLANLLLAPLLEWFLLLAFFLFPFGKISWVSSAFSFYGNSLLQMTHGVSRLRGITVAIEYPAVQICLVATLAAVWVGFCLPRHSRRHTMCTASLGLSASVICLLICTLIQNGQSAVYYQNTRGNEQLAFAHQGAVFLYDAGYGGYAGTVSPSLSAMRYLHVTEIEGYIISHYHANHPDSFDDLAARSVIRTLYLPTPQDSIEEAYYHALCASAAQRQIAVVRYEEPATLTLRDARLYVHPRKEGSSHAGISISIRLSDTLFTYLGSGYPQNGGASVVRQSTHLLFGLHGGDAAASISYTDFSSDLAGVWVAGQRDRLPLALQRALHQQDIPVRETGGRYFIPFP